MEDHLFVPDWLNKEFLKSAIQQEVSGSNIDVTKYDIQLAVSKDNHFTSSLLRVSVEYSFTDQTQSSKTGTKHLIVKSLPKSEMMRAMLTQTGIFKRETDVYLVALPAMYSLAEELMGSKVQYLTSRCIYSVSDVLVLEDLNHLGYKMADRRRGLDLPHCQLALRSLAQFHGMSVALHREHPSSMSLFHEVFYKEEQRQLLSFTFEPGMQALAAVVAKWPGYERFADKIRKMAETMVTKALEAVKPIDGSLSVLNHGDFWTNNMVFKYPSGSEIPEEAKFVDFQASRFTSPALDLQYFMFTSPSQEVRFEHMDGLLETYHTELRKTLTMLGCSDVEFTIEHLKKDFEDKAYFGLITACVYLNMMLADPKESVDVDNVTLEDFKAVEGNPMVKSMSGTLFRETFQKVLLHFESKGLL
jgi:hypothetical protein